MSSQYDFSSIFSGDNNTGNSKLYSFLATSYDLNALANKVRTNYSVRKNILSLKMNGSSSV